ncbi:type VII secretion protein EssA [Peribacillus deserti]|uniref:Type VII secretion protein EssA n=1 Tax=Peribacillus deserti TaxID=673318 RepID=A0ABS2QMU3_9BACI|nr:type VII secretion protein EssA [Peribacillus deserti]MBM7694490.1 type VII secretion protein EssA [Peribacillus deserti]
MKLKAAAKISFLLALLVMFYSPWTGAADNNVQVEPNTYKEKDIELQTEYFHEDALLKEKEQLSEEQKMLTFKRHEQELYNQIKGKLFLETENKTTTVSAKAKKLNLFSGQSMSRPDEAQASERDEEGVSSYLPLVLGFILALCILYMFFILVPKMTHTSRN